MNGIDKLQALPAGIQATIGVLALVQITLIVIALIKLARTDGRIKGVPRAAWLIIILLGQLLGSTIFLIAAHLEQKDRREKQGNELSGSAPSAVVGTAQQKADTETAIGHLYGDAS